MSMTERERYFVVVGTLLRLLRERAGLSQGKLATCMDSSQPSLSRYERGDDCPTLWQLRLAGQALGVSPVQVLEIVEIAFAADVSQMPARIARAALMTAAYQALQAVALPAPAAPPAPVAPGADAPPRSPVP